jgi:hypothetical protein
MQATTQVQTTNIKRHTIVGYYGFSSTVKTPTEAINLGLFLDKTRKENLNLDISPIKEKKLIQFHWDDMNLVLEFKDDLFLKIEALKQSVNGHFFDIRIMTTNSIITDRDCIIEEIHRNNRRSLWNRQLITQNYLGKIFKNIQIGDQEIWLYFYHSSFLIHCTLQQIKEYDTPILSWVEGE